MCSRPSPQRASPPLPALYQLLLRALTRLDSYLRAPLEHELVRQPQLRESRRRFLDGDQLTLADCGLLPKLHIVDVRAGLWAGDRRVWVGGASLGRGPDVPAPLATRRQCVRTSARRPSQTSCTASAATWTARYRKKSSSTRVRTAPRSWRPTGPSYTPASTPAPAAPSAHLCAAPQSHLP